MELADAMRQRGDYNFIRLLNNIREGNVDKDVERISKLRFSEKTSYPENVVHIFAEKRPTKKHNKTRLNNLYYLYNLIRETD